MSCKGEGVAQARAHIYRTTDGVMGGVCSGIAKRLDLDAAVVRMLVVLLTVLSAGAFAVVYIAIWLILPIEPGQGMTYDVDPAGMRAGVSAPSYAAHEVSSTINRPVAVGLVLGIMLIVLGAAALFSGIMDSFTVMQFWPLVLLVVGVVRIAIPARDGSRTFTTWLGALIILAGIIALVSSLGIYTVDTDTWISRAGPFLLIAAGLFIMGRAAHSDVLIALAGIALVLFVVVGALFSLHDGASDVGVSLRFSPSAIEEPIEG